jgi:hypothetical protein
MKEKSGRAHSKRPSLEFWFGGKSTVADLVWSRFGDVKNYVEPFAGSLAVLLARPVEHFQGDSARIETVNDINAWLTNFWRACQKQPDVTAYWADQPTSELDLHARGDALFYRGMTGFDGKFRTPEQFIEALRAEEDWFDPKVAGWWVWGQSNWIGDNWGRKQCRAIPCLNSKGINRQRPHLHDAGKGVAHQLPHLGTAGQGISKQLGRKLPHLGTAGQGISKQLGRKRPIMGYAGHGVSKNLPEYQDENLGECARHLAALEEWFAALADRLRHVRICCGDWTRVVKDSVILHPGTPTAIFLDPPYSQKSGLDTVYGENHDQDLSAEVCKWALVNGDRPELRICLAGYEGEHTLPESWECVEWKATGGYGNQGDNSRGQENSKRERFWFSPHALKPAEKEQVLFEV